MEDLPIYEATINSEYQEGSQELGWTETAYTADPAIIIKGMAYKNQNKEAVLQHFADEKKYRITAPAMIPMDIYRADEDGEYEVRFTAEEIETIFVKYMSQVDNKKQLFNLEHNAEQKVPSYLLEAWLVDDPKGDKAYTTFGIEVPKGTLMLTTQVTDKDYYNKLVENNQLGYSIEAFLALKEPKDFEAKKEELNKQHTMELPNGIFTAEDGTKYKFNKEGVLVKFEVEEEKEVAPVEEVVAEASAEPVAEVAMEEVVEEEEEVVMEDEPKEEEMAVDPEADAQAILAIVQPLLDEIYQEIAILKGELDENAEEAPAEDSEVEMSASTKLSKIHKFLSNG